MLQLIKDDPYSKSRFLAIFGTCIELESNRPPHMKWTMNKAKAETEAEMEMESSWMTTAHQGVMMGG